MLLLVSSSSYAVTIQQLQKSNDVEIKAWLSDGKDKLPSFSVNEQVILYVEVATPRWLTGGTRIESVEISNVIAKQRNQLATNYTERKGGQTWSRQRWEITLYPVKSGSYTVPPLAVSVQVSAPDGSNVVGSLYTQPLAFNVSLPSGLLSEGTPWFTATNVDVKQEWSQSSDDLKVGDAITRKVTVEAQDSLSVLLPNLLKSESSTYFQAYPQPHRLDDSQTRGDYQSSRVEETVYVIQQGGDFKLPEHQFQWWNAKTNKLETVTLEGKQFHARHIPASFVKANLRTLVTTLAVLVIALGMFFAGKRYYRSHPTPPWLLFWFEVRKGDWSKARAHLYRHLRVSTDHLEMGKAGNEKAWLTTSHQVQSGEGKARIFQKMWRMISNKHKSSNRFKLPKALPKLDKGHKQH
ncbi:BatD family protein [Photobacterium rosenbergii]|uniref:BatD family protein n=2 Tax=Photobacterium rosenbergii TaxID=294936 RepID=A0ABU3ZFE1_9GAMM|nr:BatD family protein [Photobacterium rosenbergii]MDV5168643.1 BatD family protein [Photobacterium rosenbergii]